MAGRTPSAALDAFTAPIREALGCFARGRVAVDSRDPAVEGVLRFNGADDVRLGGAARVTISVSMRYRLVKQRAPFASPGKPWKVSTTGWIYTLKDANRDLLADFHWHPALTPDIRFPHLHAANEATRRHLPTGRVLVEDVLTLAVECGAEPADLARWDRIRDQNVENFGKGATWGIRHPPSSQ